MSATFPVNKQTGRVYTRILLSSEQASTFHSDRIMLGKAIVIAKTESIAQNTDAFNEQEWQKIVNTPRVRHGLRRLAAEARRQIAAEETQEGGFAVE